MIDFNTDRLIIVFYPGGAGGKFLINSLGLSANAVFQDNALAMKQVNESFTPEDKFNHLQKQISLVTTHWNDLNLGCEQLFGFDNNTYLGSQPVNILPNIKILIDNNLYFFIVAHNSGYLKKYKQHWPNAKIIAFENTKNFILNRGNFRTANQMPTTDAIIRSIIGYDFEVSRLNIDHIQWDTDWFLSKDNTVSNIRQLYTLLGLPDFNEYYISTYYDLWIKKLEQLKNISDK